MDEVHTNTVEGQTSMKVDLLLEQAGLRKDFEYKKEESLAANR